MLITKTSMLSNSVSTRDLSVTQSQIELWEAGGLIQDVMPELSSEDREFIMTGITPEEWDSVFSEEEE